MWQASSALALSDDPLDVAALAATWVCAATGCPSSSARVLIPDCTGRPVQAGTKRWPSRDRGDLRLRRDVLRWHVPRCRDSEGRSLLVQPFIAAGVFVGILELRADTEDLHARMRTVEAVAIQAALKLSLVRERSNFKLTLRALKSDGER